MIEDLVDRADLIIFDWDGTLIDSHDYIIDSMLRAAEARKLEIPSRETVSAIIGMSMVPAIMSLFPHLDENQVVEFRRVYTDHYNDKSRPQPELFEGVHETLEHLRDLGKGLAVATGKRKPGLLSGLEDTGTGHFFSELRTADDCASKPSPEMVLSILKATDGHPEKALVIGDNVLDIKMAKSAGVASVGVTTGSSSGEEMKQEGAITYYRGFPEIFDLLGSA